MATYPPELEAYVQQKIASGEFNSRDELAVEAVRLYREIEQKRAQLKADVQAAIDEPIADCASPWPSRRSRPSYGPNWTHEAGRSNGPNRAHPPVAKGPA
jgi:putative addiction module CopG family antidote